MAIKTFLILMAGLLILSLTACQGAAETTKEMATTIAPDKVWQNDAVITSLIPVLFAEPSVPSTAAPEAPDDIVPTPGGFAYRANVHQQGVLDKWPSIPITRVEIGDDDNPLQITYRDNIETRAGEIRHNLIGAKQPDKPGMEHELKLYTTEPPEGFKLTYYNGAGLPGTAQKVLVINISSSAAAGTHILTIGIEFDGKYYDTVPCAITVVE